MFTSDNGPDFSDSGEGPKARFNCGFNGAKGSVYEGGIRVPMLVRWPGGLDGSLEVQDMVHFCDWFPTLLSAAGLEVPAGLDIDGVNVLPVLRGDSRDVPSRRFWQWNRYEPVVSSDAAMRDGDWKLVRPVIKETMNNDARDREMDGALRREPWKPFEPDRSPFPPREIPPPPQPGLYNIAEDPLEQADLSERNPARVRTMLRELETWFEGVEADRATIGGFW